MNRLTHERCSGIKTGYWTAAKKEELVQRLAAYENTSMEPEQVLKYRWRNAKTEQPTTDDFVLAIVNGKPARNITLVDAHQIASFCPREGWIIDEFLQWENPQVHWWMPLPEAPEEE